MKQYLETLQKIMESGVDRNDRTGTGTRAVFAEQMRFDLQDGFPAMTTKKLAFKAVKSELLWMIEGSSDERRLAEINGTDKTIWTANAEADYWKPKADFDGDLGRVYGVQWRDWQTYGEQKGIDSTDQLQDVIQRIKDKPWDRRHVVSAWNPGELDQMALPPCHMIYQFFVGGQPVHGRRRPSGKFNPNGVLSCHMTQRSCDMFLGVPFNIASYALLTHMVAQVCNLDVGELVVTLNDAHIYNNHFDQVQEQMTRTPGELPSLWLNPEVKNIDDFTMDDIKLENYNPQETIKASMAV